ncbi:phospholipase D-like domain-containing protein [Paenibacillus radicis (ex Gao et al. 2016)]|uniref:phospholipase D n=1 Tax=Paenibacillus radicis (ex Gao et al. 2016) TaxID=1737354 RepID=A0A917M791_9BACL|nr:phospholipase D-like domain-containing protein [Paenibacillus radicis (ex Gao et al. 2016)]GGG82009.1 hypothetical protein GCM10010918_44170 [Paenibacillus radicis (ex Gao et al. 2016)]
METEVYVHFDNIEEVIIRELKKTKESIKLAVAWINIPIYLETFNNLLEKKVEIELVISDDIMNKRYSSLLGKLQEKGAIVKLLKMPFERNYMHHKFCIIDNKIILTGSYNWTSNAKKNFENLMVVIDEIAVRKFNDEFKLLMKSERKLLKELINTEKCEEKKCKGTLCNVLVFEDVNHKYGHLNVSIVSVCSEDYESHSSVIKSDIETDNLIYQINDILDYYNDNEEQISDLYSISRMNDMCDYRIKKCLDNHLDDVKKYKGVTIHGIGFVEQEPFGTEGDSSEITTIKWKNKFVASFIPDKYHCDLSSV